MHEFSEQELEALIQAAPKEEQLALLKAIEELNTRRERELAKKDFIAFVKSVWPDFISGEIGRAHV